MFQWYSYIPGQYQNLIVGIDWTNFFFSLLLTGTSFILILSGKKAFSGNKDIVIFYGFIVFVWFCRVVITVVEPWPLEPVPWAAYGQQLAALAIFILLLIPLYPLIKNIRRQSV
jgi:hypothetical protein